MEEHILDTIYNQKATFSSIFGEQSINNYSDIIQPRIVDLPNSSVSAFSEYLLLFLLVGFIIYVIISNRDGFSRIMLPAFSFPSMTRRVESLDRSLDNAAKKTLFLGTMIILVYLFKDKILGAIYNPDQQDLSQALRLAASVLAIVIVTPLIAMIIDRYSKHRYFYNRLYILERVQLAGYILLLIPINILMFVSSPFRAILVGISVFLVFVYLIHNIIVVIRYFLREKLSFYQLFLYLCTLKAAFIFILIYYIVSALEIK